MTTTPENGSSTTTRSKSIAEARALAAAQKAAERNSVTRQDATGTSIERRAETAAAAVAANAEAMAKARFFVAMQRPRDLDVVREKLLEASALPDFAEEATWTLKRWNSTKKREEPIHGFTVRFAECARQLLGNTDVDTLVLYDDEEKVIAQVIVTDLESNTTERAPVVVRKRKERRRLRAGQEVISQRQNSEGARRPHSRPSQRSSWLFTTPSSTKRSSSFAAAPSLCAFSRCVARTWSQHSCLMSTRSRRSTAFRIAFATARFWASCTSSSLDWTT